MLNRREFIKLCQALGLVLPLQATSKAGANQQQAPSGFDEPIIIIGAGAAGLSAAYLLQQQGVEFKILEASSRHGGRMKRNTGFANFPIPLGAEWIHVDPSILREIVNDPSIEVATRTTRYDPKVDYALYGGRRITLRQADFTEDSKFINATWFDFFEQYVLPAVSSQITYNAVVEAVDYSSDRLQIRTSDQTYSASRVIVAVPVKILKTGAIEFTPLLPARKARALERARVWDGCKAFIEFSTKFYPALVGFNIRPAIAEQKLYYDAAYGQQTSQHILGLFAVGTGAHPYIELDDDALIRYMLDELDELFDGRATPNYVKHIFQNWNAEPFAQGAYVIDDEKPRVLRRLGESVDSRLYFAGDAYTTGEDWSSVHTAARSARRAVDEILNDSKS